MKKLVAADLSLDFSVFENMRKEKNGKNKS
jgi:hypothetical protein